MPCVVPVREQPPSTLSTFELFPPRGASTFFASMTNFVADTSSPRDGDGGNERASSVSPLAANTTHPQTMVASPGAAATQCTYIHDSVADTGSSSLLLDRAATNVSTPVLADPTSRVAVQVTDTAFSGVVPAARVLTPSVSRLEDEQSSLPVASSTVSDRGCRTACDSSNVASAVRRDREASQLSVPAVSSPLSPTVPGRSDSVSSSVVETLGQTSELDRDGLDSDSRGEFRSHVDVEKDAESAADSKRANFNWEGEVSYVRNPNVERTDVSGAHTLPVKADTDAPGAVPWQHADAKKPRAPGKHEVDQKSGEAKADADNRPAGDASGGASQSGQHAAETDESHRRREKTKKEHSDEGALLRPKKKRGDKKADEGDESPTKKRKERPGEEGDGKTAKEQNKAREGGGLEGGAKKPLSRQKRLKKRRTPNAHASSSDSEDEPRGRRSGVSKKRKSKPSDGHTDGDSSPEDSDQEADRELEVYVEAITKKLWTIYTQQVADAQELLEQQISKGGLNAVSNEGVATALMTACAPRRVDMTSLLAGALECKQLATRRLLTSLTEFPRSIREPSPPRISESDILELAVAHAETDMSASSQEPNASQEAVRHAPRPGKPPRESIPSKHDLIHVSADQGASCCPCCSSTCLNLVLAPLLASSEKAGETGDAAGADARLRAQLNVQDCCCCCVIHAPSGPSSDDEGPSRPSYSTAGWAYADQATAFDQAKSKPQYTASDDDDSLRGEVGSSRVDRGGSSRPPTQTGGRGRRGAGLRGGVGSRTQALGQSPMRRQALGLLSRTGASAPLNRGAMFGTPDQRPEKWMPRSAAMRRLQQSSIRSAGAGEKAPPHGGAGGGAHGAQARTSAKRGGLGLSAGRGRLGKPTKAASSSSSDSSSDTSSDSSSSSEDETAARTATSRERKKRETAKGGAEHLKKYPHTGGGGTTRTGGSPLDRATLKARLQRFCRQDGEQKLPVLKEACVAMFVTAMKELCVEPWAQHFSIRILLRSADAALPQFLRKSGLLLLREWMEGLATSPESVEEHEGMLISVLKLLHRLRPTRQDIAQAKIGLLVRGMAQRKKVLKCDFEACSEEVSAVAEKLLEKWRAMFAPSQPSDGQVQTPARAPGSAASEAGRSTSRLADSFLSRGAAQGEAPSVGASEAPALPRPGARSESPMTDAAPETETGRSALNGGEETRRETGKQSALGGERKARVEEALRSLEELGWNLEDKDKQRRLEIEGTYSPTADTDEVQEVQPVPRKATEDHRRRVHFCPTRQAVADMVFFNNLDEPRVVNASVKNGQKLKGDEAAEHLACLRQSKAEADSFDRLRRMHTYKEIDGCTATGSGEHRVSGTKPATESHTHRRDAPMKFTTPLPLDFSDGKPPHAYPSPPPAPVPPHPESPPVRVEPPKQLFATTPFSFLAIPTISSDAQGAPAPKLHVDDEVAKGMSLPLEELSRGTSDEGTRRPDPAADGDSRGLPGSAPAAGGPLAMPPFGLPPGPPLVAGPPGVPFFPAPCFPPMGAPGFPPFGPPYVALPPPGFMQPPPHGIFGLPPQSEGFGAGTPCAGRSSGFPPQAPGRGRGPPRGRGGHPAGGRRPEGRGPAGDRGRGVAEEEGSGRGRR
ncbi:hypothetical protein TGVEG_269710 [Toxoplasma gondii VEG]|uniref:TFIIS N-terminal domain-containing protein n=4 Tax=Toxoplasma gondii TaxID=5811 RepID=V5BMI9_TOXGV|nr:hypothetical protein TGVEG_269710 [Toxoplasma gondii VEG]KFG52346.1 hypothetical protein TGP89_269710 [Toxoplasma gondii p89]PUA87800.1 hypothetical protein TGBR9_269710 [Toxoplasma gondii TgCATBr9]